MIWRVWLEKALTVVSVGWHLYSRHRLHFDHVTLLLVAHVPAQLILGRIVELLAEGGGLHGGFHEHCPMVTLLRDIPAAAIVHRCVLALLLLLLHHLDLGDELALLFGGCRGHS